MTWRDIANDLARKIQDGTPKVGEQIKFSELMQTYDASRSTMQRAMSRVEDLGYAEFRPGKGWFATKP